jgi:hypothetical protein
MIFCVWEVVWLPEAEAERDKLVQAERDKLVQAERNAVRNATAKLEALGPDLPYPRSSAIAGTPGLRELRPRGGNSPVRPLYARRGAALVIAAIGPEAKSDPHGFRQACQHAAQRLTELEED